MRLTVTTYGQATTFNGRPYRVVSEKSASANCSFSVRFRVPYDLAQLWLVQCQVSTAAKLIGAAQRPFHACKSLMFCVRVISLSKCLHIETDHSAGF